MYNHEGKMPLARLQVMPTIQEGETKYLKQLGRKGRTPGSSSDRARETSSPNFPDFLFRHLLSRSV